MNRYKKKKVGFMDRYQKKVRFMVDIKKVGFLDRYQKKARFMDRY